MTQEGRAFVFGDNIDTDVLAPGPYMREPIEVMAAHCLEAVDPEFSKQVAAGDIIVAGEGFGMGSSREQAVQVLAKLGVGAVLAKSFARIFYRNAINLGLPALTLTEAAEIGAGDLLRVDPSTGQIDNLTRSTSLQAEPIPDFLLEIIQAGGLMRHLKKQLGTANDS